MNTMAMASGALWAVMHKGMGSNPWHSVDARHAFDAGYWVVLGHIKSEVE